MQTLQASSTSCSDSRELNITSGLSESLDVPVDNPENSGGSSNITVVCSQHHNESQTVYASTDTTNEDTNEERVTLTDRFENCSQPADIDGKEEIFENVSENAYEMLDSEDIEPTAFISHMLPSDSLSGERSLLEFKPGVFTGDDLQYQTTTDIHTEGDFPSLTPVADVGDDLDIPSSSPPVSSPLTSGYFRSSSPTSMPSSPGYGDLTPPTSPVKISHAKTELANIQIDNFEKAPDVEIKFNRFEIDSAELVNDENVTTTVEERLPAKDDAHITDHGVTPREKVHQRLIPGPKRATLAAQEVRLKKLSKPFRPPGVQKPVVIVKQENITTSDNAASKPVAHASPFAMKIQEKLKNRTAKAGAQFKSPLGLSSAGGEAGALVRPTPTIQALERKLQLLKRSVKVKEDSEEEILSELVQKWTEAGREIAWEVWGLVKESSEVGNKRQVADSWGWQDSGDSKRQKTEERLWRWDVIPVCERETEVEEGHQRTLGTMLMEMGIAPSTFGWNAEEERFED